MCATSAVYEYMYQNVPVTQWQPDTFNQLERIIKLLEDLDKKLGQPDCVDPEKAAYLDKVRELLAKSPI